jgi:hypothetical protein
MAKNKRKVYATQRDKLAIDTAIYLKKIGVISKNAKMHGGKYISREVLAKVQKHQSIARLNYTTVKVDKATARAAKERGYEVFQGTRIVGPKSATFRNRLKSGQVTGLKPVKGGYMEEVILPHSVYDIQSLINMGSIDTLKLEDEFFAFKYKGWESYSMFSSTDKLIETLMGYKSIAATLMSDKPEDLQGELANIVIYRLHREDEHLIPSFKERQKKRAAIRAQEIRDGLRVPRKNKKTRAQRLAELSDRERNWRLEMYAEKDRAKRANMTKAERAVYRAKAAARAKASRERNK